MSGLLIFRLRLLYRDGMAPYQILMQLGDIGRGIVQQGSGITGAELNASTESLDIVRSIFM